MEKMPQKSNTSEKGSKYCIVCGSEVAKFIPFGSIAAVFKEHHVIAAGYRENCVCPVCRCFDRVRFQYYILKNKTNIETMSGRILHIAPEKGLFRLITSNPCIDYYSGDIIPRRAMHFTDITDIQYKDGVFDYVISNHVLEHIKDEAKAVSEIKRVLKKDGKWIFSFPICTDCTTIEDESITEPADRLRVFGKSDHVRLYGTDYRGRFEKYGFKITVYSPQNEFNEDEIEKYGFIADDVVMIAEKTDILF